MIDAYNNAGGGPAGEAAANAVFDAAANDVTEATITLGKGVSNNDKLHEVGHIEQALLQPQDFLVQGEEARQAKTVEEYNQTESEIYAENFAREARKNER